MFTGLVRHLGTLAWRRARAGGARVCVEAGAPLLGGLVVGPSMAVMGACLTVAAMGDGRDGRGGCFEADVSGGTLLRTALGMLQTGAPLNLEPALRAGDPLDGHLVSGHVDATAGLLERPEGEGLWLCGRPWALAALVAPKGSVAVDGVGLTVVEATSRWFTASLMPGTLGATTLGLLRPGDRVNLEGDPVARYVARLVGLRGAEERLAGFADGGWKAGG
jgi:riboflavin synthase